MANLGAFNPDAVHDEERELLPPGMYTAHVMESDLVTTKAGDGQILKLTFEILEGPLAKRRVWENLNIVNRNAQAQDIAQRQLKRLCNAIGHSGVLTDSEQLHFKPMRIRVAVEDDKTGQYAPSNRVKGFEALRGSAPAAQVAATSADSAPTQAYTPPQQQAAAGGGSRPWSR